MSTNIENNPLDSPFSPIISRKQHHIDVCKEGSGFQVEGQLGSAFSEISFIHEAMPEIAWDDISTAVSFLGCPIKFPLFISCMTGGSAEGKSANRALAQAAQTKKLPIGLGSMRVLLDHPERAADFQIKKIARDVPVMANIGAVQIRELSFDRIRKLLEMIEADALVIHLNCGQEIFQPGGDTDFTGLLDAISRCTDHSGVPVIVKETGFGIHPRRVKTLLDRGVAYVDLAGSGGTNWVLVEECCKETRGESAAEFASWGIPTAPLVAATRPFNGKILASGGLRTGMDLAKSIAMGAVAGGMALPLIQAALKGGAEAVCDRLDAIEHTFRSVMLLTGCRSIAELQKAPLIYSPNFQHYLQQLNYGS